MKNKKGIFFICTGLLLISAALFITVNNFAENYTTSQGMQQILVQLEETIYEEQSQGDEHNKEQEEVMQQVIPDYMLNPNMDMPTKCIDGRDYIGTLEIPELGLELPVLGEWNYENLKIAPCCYAGSAYTQDFVIAAHNYSSHFLGINKLKTEEQIIFTDIDGNKFVYQVVLKEVLEESAVEEVISGGFDITLFTCTYDGKNRVVIRGALL